MFTEAKTKTTAVAFHPERRRQAPAHRTSLLVGSGNADVLLPVHFPIRRPRASQPILFIGSGR